MLCQLSYSHRISDYKAERVETGLPPLFGLEKQPNVYHRVTELHRGTATEETKTFSGVYLCVTL